MTIIATAISKTCTAHATDSLVTHQSKPIGEATKIIRVPKWAGVMSFFGVARLGQLTIQKFLEQQVELAEKCCSSPEEFADMVSEALGRFAVMQEEIIGIHFTAYEKHNGFLIPELFRIANWELVASQDVPKYIHSQKDIEYRRETYANIPEGKRDAIPREHHSEAHCRHKVRAYLEAGEFFIFNNGDTPLFNLSLNGIFQMLQIASEYKKLRIRGETGTRDYRSLVTLPIEQVIKLQDAFFLPKHKKVGGPLHNISVTPEGNYESDTKD